MQTFFPEYAGDFPPAGMQIDQKKKKKEGKGKTYFDMRNSGECHLPPRVAQRFLIIVNGRGMPLSPVPLCKSD